MLSRTHLPGLLAQFSAQTGADSAGVGDVLFGLVKTEEVARDILPSKERARMINC